MPKYEISEKMKDRMSQIESSGEFYESSYWSDLMDRGAFDEELLAGFWYDASRMLSNFDSYFWRAKDFCVKVIYSTMPAYRKEVIDTVLDSIRDEVLELVKDLENAEDYWGWWEEHEPFTAKEAKKPVVRKPVVKTSASKKPVSKATTTKKIMTRKPTAKLKGLSFCFTGELKSLKRKEAEEKVKALGGSAKSTVAKGLSYLVTNDPKSGSSKNKKAAELGVKIIDEKKFLALIGMK